jgi:hypothetical protein
MCRTTDFSVYRSVEDTERVWERRAFFIGEAAHMSAHHHPSQEQHIRRLTVGGQTIVA